jgi:hypothetical protein
MKSFSFTKAVSILVIGVIVGVLVGGAVAVRYVRGHAHAPATWRSLVDPVPDTTAEEYAVYSTIIGKVNFEERLRVFVLRDHTEPCARTNDWCAHKGVRSRLPNLRPETLDDYVIQNRESEPLGENFKLQRPAVMLSDHDFSGMLIRTNRKVNFSPLPGRTIQWNQFYDHYPLSSGVISLSRVGFDSQIQQALVYEETAGSADGTWGRFLVLTKESGKWVVQDKIESYFPEEPRPSLKQGEWGTLKGQILDANAEGLDEVELDLLSCGWDIGSLDEALARDTVVLAEVSGKKTLADKYGLRTWYRFRLVEALSEKPMPKYMTYDSLPDPPYDMRPLSEDEFVILEANGDMEIDGVRVRQRSNGVVYTTGGTYLLFLHIEPAKRVAFRSATDPLGVFLVAKDGTFKAHIDSPYPLRDEMTRRYGNSIEKLRTALKTTPAKP